MLATAVVNPDLWRFEAHPEVWALVLFLVGAWIYAIKVIGPRVVPPGERVVTPWQVTSFVAAIALLWFASDWPVHDLAEQYFYSVHMVQHLMFTYFLAPLVWFATPAWLGRLLLGQGRSYRVVRKLAKPIVAGIIFNAVVVITHIPALVNASVQSAPLHYSLHVAIVLSSLLMWLPLVGPFPEMRMGSGLAMLYLFWMSVIPTVPAGWLTFADGVVYTTYDHNFVFYGLTPTQDQQLAGIIMKIGGSMFLWSVIAVLFFRRFMGRWEQENARPYGWHDDEITGHDDEVLTYERVHRYFQAVPPAEEPAPPAPPNPR